MAWATSNRGTVLALSRDDLLPCLRAISDPLRLRILVLLAHPPGARSGPFAEDEPGMCVSDLRGRLGRAHALVSHHVQVLLRAGLIRRLRRGRWSLLQLDTGRVEALGEQIASLASDQLPARPPGTVGAPLPVLPVRIGAPVPPPVLPLAPAPRKRDGENGATGAFS